MVMLKRNDRVERIVAAWKTDVQTSKVTIRIWRMT